jgi:hypothetical protein
MAGPSRAEIHRSAKAAALGIVLGLVMLALGPRRR